MTQLVIPNVTVVEAEIDGIEMGVLSDGTPYLTIRGLAKSCGIAPSSLIEQLQAWAQGKRTSKLARAIQNAGYDGDRLSIELAANRHAVPDSVCILVLEHYALDQDNKIAVHNYRVLARAGLRTFIYRTTGYNPSIVLPRGWRDFHDRLVLAKIPAGYFSVFREMSEFLLRAIQGGLLIDEHTVPDISVGQLWSKEWTQNNFDAHFGPRVEGEHNYPDYYPQAASNPQTIWIYPLSALGAFRMWLDVTYIPQKFPNYLHGKVKKHVLSSVAAEKLLAAVLPAELTE